jgi:hypothetical protein
VIRRRQLLGALLGGLGHAACARSLPAPAPPPAPTLAIDPLVDLVAAAGLAWLIDLRPRMITADPTLDPLLAAAVPDGHLDGFAERHGFDLRLADELTVAGSGDATLGLARLPVDLARIEAAFTKRSRAVEGRGVERGVTRFWGTVGDEREQVALFGTGAVGIERGSFGPLRTAAYFAQGRLHRALPALRAEPLQSAAAALGSDFLALRAFLPGPFGGSLAGGLGGLLSASTAMAVGLRSAPVPALASAPMPTSAPAPAPAPAAEPGLMQVRLILTGAWGVDAPAAADRLLSAFRALGVDPLARLVGLDRPRIDPIVHAEADALGLDVSLDPVRMVAGVRAVMSAPAAEIMAL